jgi:hypothetical protein
VFGGQIAEAVKRVRLAPLAADGFWLLNNKNLQL